MVSDVTRTRSRLRYLAEEIELDVYMLLKVCPFLSAVICALQTLVLSCALPKPINDISKLIYIINCHFVLAGLQIRERNRKLFS